MESNLFGMDFAVGGLSGGTRGDGRGSGKRATGGAVNTVEVGPNVYLSPSESDGIHLYEMKFSPKLFWTKLFEQHEALTRAKNETLGVLEGWVLGLPPDDLNLLRPHADQETLEKIFHFEGLSVESYTVHKTTGEISILRSFLLSNHDVFTVSLSGAGTFAWLNSLESLTLFASPPDMISHGKPVKKYVPTYFGNQVPKMDSFRIIDRFTYRAFPITKHETFEGYRGDYGNGYFEIKTDVARSGPMEIKETLVKALERSEISNQFVHEKNHPPTVLKLNEFFTKFPISLREEFAGLNGKLRVCETEIREANEEAEKFLLEFVKRGFALPEAVPLMPDEMVAG